MMQRFYDFAATRGHCASKFIIHIIIQVYKKDAYLLQWMN
jgi:hypothetical protein